MNNSALSSEYLSNAFRYLKQAKTSLEEGDLVGTLDNSYNFVENLSKALLALYGYYSLEEHTSQKLNLILSKLTEEKEIALVRRLQLMEEKLYPLTLLDESSFKDSVIIRNFEAKGLIKELEEIFELANNVFDEFHS
ncbi:HEPN domain-containing protein [Sulfolobus sp. S-194]|uniref:HEPN domain-containing protein n=1 Tax=Sulfolobus sp. S-194 TaxID=2512240 RepID=UPI0014373D76|nr:HEPN domain-containing protein [Sulfolobus sp. S-194]QIW23406.1 HEPN domain-containing protein [Sulfolobus sp. S-194]